MDENKPSECTEWHKEFGPALKMGKIQDAANLYRLMRLLRIKSSKNEDSYSETRTLQDYFDSMKNGKNKYSIYQVKIWRLF